MSNANWTEMNFLGEFEDFPNAANTNDLAIVKNEYYAFNATDNSWVNLKFIGNFNENSLPTNAQSNDLICIYESEIVSELN